jgi:membrane fusion protein (multidrug efflux system)
MIGSKANMGSSFPVQFMVNNTSDLKIKSGMFGKVLKSKTSRKGIIIPSSAIVGTENQPQVYIVKNGKIFCKTSLFQKRYRTKQLFQVD